MRGEGCCCLERLYVAQKERSDKAEILGLAHPINPWDTYE